MERLLEFLGTEQRVGEVDEQPRDNEAGEPIVEDHDMLLLEPVAGVSVSDREHEEAKAERDQDEVQHEVLLERQGQAQRDSVDVDRAATHDAD
jgi:hypothetical protein